MNQITEDYVSNEVGKLLEEKGFDWQQSPFYSEQDMDKWKQENSYQIPNPDYDPNIPFDTETITVVAPHISQSLALKWLREVHKIIISFNASFVNSIEPHFSWNIRINSLKSLNDGEHFEPIYINAKSESFEESCEAALLYVLKNLI